MAVQQKHYVIFNSPGTMFAEQSSREIDSWSPELACRLAKETNERHGAKPYGFRFETRLVADPVSDGQGGTLDVQPKTVAKSGMYFITGKILRLDEIPETQENSILRSNMRSNGYPVVIENTNSWKSTNPFESGDFLVDWDGKVLVKGSSPELEDYRREKISEREKELASYRR